MFQIPCTQVKKKKKKEEGEIQPLISEVTLGLKLYNPYLFITEKQRGCTAGSLFGCMRQELESPLTQSPPLPQHLNSSSMKRNNTAVFVPVALREITQGLLQEDFV